MPTNALSHPGVFQDMLEDAGFTDVVVRDYSENIKPMTRLFFLIAYVPYLLITLFHLERYFINTVAGVQSYQGHGRWRYIVISATKPGGILEAARNRRCSDLSTTERSCRRRGLSDADYGPNFLGLVQLVERRMEMLAIWGCFVLRYLDCAE